MEQKRSKTLFPGARWKNCSILWFFCCRAGYVVMNSLGSTPELFLETFRKIGRSIEAHHVTHFINFATSFFQ